MIGSIEKHFNEIRERFMPGWLSWGLRHPMLHGYTMLVIFGFAE
jgi:hypothetical protein